MKKRRTRRIFQERTWQVGEPSGEGESSEGWPGWAKVVRMDRCIYGCLGRAFLYPRLLMVRGGKGGDGG